MGPRRRRKLDGVTQRSQSPTPATAAAWFASSLCSDRHNRRDSFSVGSVKVNPRVANALNMNGASQPPDDCNDKSRKLLPRFYRSARSLSNGRPRRRSEGGHCLHHRPINAPSSEPRPPLRSHRSAKRVDETCTGASTRREVSQSRSDRRGQSWCSTSSRISAPPAFPSTTTPQMAGSTRAPKDQTTAARSAVSSLSPSQEVATLRNLRIRSDESLELLARIGQLIQWSKISHADSVASDPRFVSAHPEEAISIVQRYHELSGCVDVLAESLRRDFSEKEELTIQFLAMQRSWEAAELRERSLQDAVGAATSYSAQCRLQQVQVEQYNRDLRKQLTAATENASDLRKQLEDVADGLASCRLAQPPSPLNRTRDFGSEIRALYFQITELERTNRELLEGCGLSRSVIQRVIADGQRLRTVAAELQTRNDELNFKHDKILLEFSSLQNEAAATTRRLTKAADLMLEEQRKNARLESELEIMRKSSEKVAKLESEIREMIEEKRAMSTDLQNAKAQMQESMRDAKDAHEQRCRVLELYAIAERELINVKASEVDLRDQNRSLVFHLKGSDKYHPHNNDTRRSVSTGSTQQTADSRKHMTTTTAMMTPVSSINQTPNRDPTESFHLRAAPTSSSSSSSSSSFTASSLNASRIAENDFVASGEQKGNKQSRQGDDEDVDRVMSAFSNGSSLSSSARCRTVPSKLDGTGNRTEADSASVSFSKYSVTRRHDDGLEQDARSQQHFEEKQGSDFDQSNFELRRVGGCAEETQNEPKEPDNQIASHAPETTMPVAGEATSENRLPLTRFFTPAGDVVDDKMRRLEYLLAAQREKYKELRAAHTSLRETCRDLSNHDNGDLWASSSSTSTPLPRFLSRHDGDRHQYLSPASKRKERQR